jgi:hypothetical protein
MTMEFHKQIQLALTHMDKSRDLLAYRLWFFTKLTLIVFIYGPNAYEIHNCIPVAVAAHQILSSSCVFT